MGNQIKDNKNVISRLNYAILVSSAIKLKDMKDSLPRKTLNAVFFIDFTASFMKTLSNILKVNFLSLFLSIEMYNLFNQYLY